MKIRYTREEWIAFRKPCVYRFLAADGRPLYIGSSEFGFSRVFVQPVKHHKTRGAAMANCASLEIEFFSTIEEACNIENSDIHQWHPAGQNCSVCATDSIIGSTRPECIARHLATAESFVSSLGHIPSDTWLNKNGFADFAIYSRMHSKLFQHFPKVRYRQGRPKKS